MKLLVMTAAFGTGHNQVAQALVEAAVDGGHSAEVVDALVAGAPLLGPLLTGGFIQLLKTAPGLYGLAYDHGELPGRLDGVKHGSIQALGGLLWPRLSPILAQVQPDVVVCTHPWVLGVMAALRRLGRVRVPVVGVLTDFASHAFWQHPGVDAYCVASPDMAATMMRQGVPSSRLHVTGIPIRSMFSSAPQRLAAATALGLDPTRSTVLIMGGGLGLGPMQAVVKAVTHTALPLQVVVITGYNERLYGQLAPLAAGLAGTPTSLHLYGYVPDVARLMAASDLLVSKPGAVTAAEALALGLPMLLVEPIPGHEERNQAALVGLGAACAVPSPAAIPHVLRQLFTQPETLLGMRNAALRAGAPAAAWRVIDQLASRVDAHGAWSA